MRPLILLVSLLLLLLPPTFGQPAAIEIPYQKFVLSNGLTLVVHEDHKAPIVAVNIWYHVGSKNEKRGKTGFAHLFEHLMFNGSENFNSDYFKVLEKIGATDLNGTTNNDRTNYFQNVPTSALDTVLWMESDRMGHLLGAIDQAKLDEQRGVVQNEKRQDENQPYGLVDEPDGGEHVSGRASVLLDRDRLDGGSHRGLSRGRARVVPDLLRAVQRGVSRSPATSTPRRPGRRSSRYFGSFPPGRPSPRSKPGLPSAPARSGRFFRTACRRRVSTRSGTCRRTMIATPPISTWSPASWAKGEVRGCRSGWSTMTSSPAT